MNFHYVPLLQIEMSALAPQALGSFKASTWVRLSLFNISASLKTPQRHLVSSETICFRGKQHDTGAFSGACRYGWQGVSFFRHVSESLPSFNPPSNSAEDEDEDEPPINPKTIRNKYFEQAIIKVSLHSSLQPRQEIEKHTVRGFFMNLFIAIHIVALLNTLR